MNTQDKFRDDLPLHSVGALTPAEAAAMEEHLAQCAECSAEFASFVEASAQIGLAMRRSVPSARVRQRLMEEIQEDKAVIRSSKGPLWRFWAWTPALAAMLLAGVLLFVWRHATNLGNQNALLTSRLKANQAISDRDRALLETLTSSEALHVTLTAAGKPAPPEAKTIYSAKNAVLILNASNLVPLPEHKTYELWLLPASGGSPIPSGTFKPDAGGNSILVMSNGVPQVKPKAFAVTIEPEGGSTTPTLPIVLLGAV